MPLSLRRTLSRSAAKSPLPGGQHERVPPCRPGARAVSSPDKSPPILTLPGRTLSFALGGIFRHRRRNVSFETEPRNSAASVGARDPRAPTRQIAGGEHYQPWCGAYSRGVSCYAIPSFRQSDSDELSLWPHRLHRFSRHPVAKIRCQSQIAEAVRGLDPYRAMAFNGRHNALASN
jgi:hypothetical protein